jgi:hypothetical protein
MFAEVDHAIRRQMRSLDALVRQEGKAAYTRDRFGPVADPTAPGHLRDRVHHLAELMFDRDRRYPPWWRAVGEHPDAHPQLLASRAGGPAIATTGRLTLPAYSP